jgi:hypothetical protein
VLSDSYSAAQVPVTFDLPEAEQQRIAAAINKAPPNISTAVATGTPPQDLILNATTDNASGNNTDDTTAGSIEDDDDDDAAVPGTARSICPADSPLRASPTPSRTICRWV